MKRCIVCGNTGDDNHTVCSVCGGSFADVTENAVMENGVMEDTVMEEADMKEADMKEAAVEEAAVAVSEVNEEEVSKQRSEEKVQQETVIQDQKKQRIMKSGPHIYGQDGMAQKGAPYQDQQGMVRRNIQGGVPQGRPMRPQGRPMNMPQGQPMGPQGRPMRPQGQPMGPQGRPVQSVSYGRYRMQIMETARGMLKSPLFFLIALLNTVYLAGSVAAIFMKELNFSLYAGLLADIQLPEQAAGYMTKLLGMLTKLDTGAIVVNLIVHIPDLLFCLGIWVIFISALAARERMAGTGFGMVKVVMVLRMVLYCILMLAGLLISVTLVVAAWISGVQNMLIASIVTLVLMIVITMMLIMYYFSYFASMKTCRVNADNGEVYGSVSAYVAGLQIIMALFSVINLLSGIVNAEISNIAGSVGKMGWMILLGIWMFRYRSKLSEFDEQ